MPALDFIKAVSVPKLRPAKALEGSFYLEASSGRILKRNEDFPGEGPQKNGVKKITEYGWRLRSRSKGKAV